MNKITVRDLRNLSLVMIIASFEKLAFAFVRFQRTMHQR